MGVVKTVEHGLWQAASPLWGSSHPHYRQALWRPARQGVEGLALSDRFSGDRTASGIYRRGWRQLGIVAVRNNALDALLAQEGARAAVAFADPEAGKLAVGELVDPDGFKRMVKYAGDEKIDSDMAHGFRIGPEPCQFAVGVIAANGEFVTPGPADVYTMGGSIDYSIRPGSAFENINFS